MKKWLVLRENSQLASSLLDQVRNNYSSIIGGDKNFPQTWSKIDNILRELRKTDPDAAHGLETIWYQIKQQINKALDTPLGWDGQRQPLNPKNLNAVVEPLYKQFFQIGNSLYQRLNASQ